MSVYNIVFGYDPTAPVVLAILEVHSKVFARFRDAWIADVGELAVYTRLGGNNRETWQTTIDEIRKHPLYLRDVDDTFDNTFCTFYFTVPEKYREAVEWYVATYGPGLTGDQRWERAFAATKK